MDTGCNGNLVTMDIIEKAGINRPRLLKIPEHEQVDLQGLEGARCRPLYEIHLKWHQDGDTKRRPFYVVQEGPFDILIGSRQFAQDLDPYVNPALIVGRLKKNTGLLSYL